MAEENKEGGTAVTDTPVATEPGESNGSVEQPLAEYEIPIGDDFVETEALRNHRELLERGMIELYTKADAAIAEYLAKHELSVEAFADMYRFKVDVVNDPSGSGKVFLSGTFVPIPRTNDTEIKPEKEYDARLDDTIPVSARYAWFCKKEPITSREEEIANRDLYIQKYDTPEERIKMFTAARFQLGDSALVRVLYATLSQTNSSAAELMNECVLSSVVVE